MDQVVAAYGDDAGGMFVCLIADYLILLYNKHFNIMG